MFPSLIVRPVLNTLDRITMCRRDAMFVCPNKRDFNHARKTIWTSNWRTSFSQRSIQTPLHVYTQSSASQRRLRTLVSVFTTTIVRRKSSNDRSTRWSSEAGVSLASILTAQDADVALRQISTDPLHPSCAGVDDGADRLLWRSLCRFYSQEVCD
jgi:hypothetical protein